MILSFVQSPALETTSEKPFSLGTGMQAKPCHSNSGELEMRTKWPDLGVTIGERHQHPVVFGAVETDHNQSAAARHV